MSLDVDRIGVAVRWIGNKTSTMVLEDWSVVEPIDTIENKDVALAMLSGFV